MLRNRINLEDLAVAHRALRRLAPARKRAGHLLFVNDYVGPERFQWEPRQHNVANVMLTALPERLRRQWDGGTKRRTHAPSRLRMCFVDPSEAAESRRIIPALRERFEILEERDLGVRPREVVDALEWRLSSEGAVSAEAIVGVEGGG